MNEFYERLDKELARNDLDGIAIADARVMRQHLKAAVELLEAEANSIGSAYKMGEPSNFTQGGATPPAPAPNSVPHRGPEPI